MTIHKRDIHPSGFARIPDNSILTPAHYRQQSATGIVKHTGIVLLSSLFLLLATGCETTEGFGRDVEKLGSNIEEAAADNK